MKTISMDYTVYTNALLQERKKGFEMGKDLKGRLTAIIAALQSENRVGHQNALHDLYNILRELDETNDI